jgi:hypothetical protein
MAIVLVVMWLVVLVPMFVGRGDERAESRSMDRFATAMRVLSRRTPGSGGVATRRRYAPAPYPDGASPVRTAARARMLRRRRRTLAVLVATAAVGVPAALALSGWFWLAQVPATLLLAGYVGWLRTQVRREHERRARRREMFGTPAAEHAVRRAPVAAAADAEPAGRPRRPSPTPSYVLAPAVRRRTESMVDLDDDDLSFTDLDPLDEDVDLPRAVNE